MYQDLIYTNQDIRPFHEIFEWQVSQIPDKIAIACDGQTLTYQELNQHANQLAHYLRSKQIGPGQRVGLYVDRSLEIAVGILGILKAGAAYVPLDPKYPRERSAFILQETDISLLLTQTGLMHDLPETKVPAICLQLLREQFDSVGSTNLTPLGDINSLAYIMYTSGSTGKPKGVQITHTNIWYYLRGVKEAIPVTPADVYLHTASMAFSSSVRQLMLPLSQGATLIIATRANTQNPLNLFQFVHQQNVTVLDTVASVWRHGITALESQPENRDLLRTSRLNKLIFSGGLLPCQLLQNVRQQFDQVPQIFNIYGQTETLGVSAYAVPASFDQDRGYVPVGTCYDHNQVYLLDERLQSVPPDQPGELCIVGPNVTQGYWHRPDINQQKFIVNPLVTESSHPLFRSGDVARWRPDGQLEILGRTDFQVKIRGMRVELDEIAAILEQYPAVKEAAIAAHEDHLGEKLLVAYYVPTAASPVPTTQFHGQLRGHLQAKLPDYMVPAIFMELEALPLTPNGKLNRLDLPKPNFLRDEPSAVPTSSLSPMRQVFCHAMHLRQVEPEDTFISLGGHSLLYVQLSIELERHLGYLPPGWEEMSIHQLEQLAPRHQATSLVESSVFFRALAICFVVIGHANLFPGISMIGGAALMLMIAGMNFARFQSAALFAGDVFKPLNSLLKNLLIPYLLISVAYQLVSRDLSLSVLLLVSNFFSPHAPSIFPVWFIQVLAQCILLMTGLLALQPVRHFASQDRWRFGLILVAVSLFLATLIPLFWDTNYLFNRVPHMMFWLFAMGWLLQFSQTRFQKVSASFVLLASILITVNTISKFCWLLIGGMTILWMAFIPVPKRLKSPIQLISAAAYHIYLTHIITIHFWHELREIIGRKSDLLTSIIPVQIGPGVREMISIGGALVIVVSSVAVGVGLWWLSQQVLPLVFRRQQTATAL